MSVLDLRAVERRFVRPRTLGDIVAGRPAESLHALRGIDLSVTPGECLGIVGESGCGKSTLARVAAGLQQADAGVVKFEGEAMDGPDPAGRLQMVFQDPYASLDPRMTVAAQLAEVVRHYRTTPRGAVGAEVARMLAAVGLTEAHGRSYPHALSGGQRQRVSIARALAARPKLLIADEPVSALDASVQAQILNLLMRLRAETGVTIVVISHDLHVVRHLCDRIAVMYLGEIVELRRTDALFDDPRHPYTRMLLAALPTIDGPRPAGVPVRGELPDPFARLPGCRFAPRCPLAEAACERPQALRQVAAGGGDDPALVRCWKAGAADATRGDDAV